jgi:predicted nucleic acid-binding protein
MTSVFVDTAALIALGDKGDRFHHQALKVRDNLKRANRKLITTNAVILELASYFRQTKHRLTAIKLIESINRSKKWRCITVDEILMEHGFNKYKKMSDKDWSLVDCISMLVAEEQGITEIFTTDHHFEQAGFAILLKE